MEVAKVRIKFKIDCSDAIETLKQTEKRLKEMSITYLLLTSELLGMTSCPRQDCGNREFMVLGFDLFECTKCRVHVTTRCQRCGKALVPEYGHPAVSRCPDGCGSKPVLVTVGDVDQRGGHVSLKEWLSMSPSKPVEPIEIGIDIPAIDECYKVYAEALKLGIALTEEQKLEAFKAAILKPKKGAL